jgi:RNA polymerase sigma factor (sigma-70 family)
MITSDLDLLRKYQRENSEEAFAELVNRHLNLVYSAALRQVRSRELAEEVAQSAFTDLARNAHRLAPDTILTAWLYQVTRRTAIDVVRREARRQLREQIATEMNAMNATTADWTHIEPLLDDAMDALDDTDRAAVLLRFFENKSLREVGAMLGTSDDAAQKRVSRALERLREFLAKRGVTVGAGGLGIVISANAVQSAPIGLATTIATTTVLAATSVATTATTTIAKTIAMTTLQKILITAAITAAVGTGIYEGRHTSALRTQVQILQQQEAPMTEQIKKLQNQRDAAERQLALVRQENESLNLNKAELLKLRSKVTLLGSNQAGSQAAADLSPAQNETPSGKEKSPGDIGRELGTAVAKGDPTALNKILDLAKAEHNSFNTNRIGMDDTQRGELARQTFAPLQTAFDVIGEAASKGNQFALDALTRALQIAELNGMAAQSLGLLAGNGDQGALTVLLNPEKYGVSLSSSVGALKPAADNGNQNAIDALAAVAQDETKQTLWYMAADGLTKAAEVGNSQAIDTLINLASSTNRSVQNVAVLGLKGAAANQNSKAIEALRLKGIP